MKVFKWDERIIKEMDQRKEQHMLSKQEEWRLDQNKKKAMWAEECEHVWVHILTN